MVRTRPLAIVLLILIAAAAHAQLPPSKERGFKPELVYQFGNFDNVTLFNGNLTAAIPLGPTYPVGAGLSYSFVLRYSGGLWRTFEDCRYVQNPGGADNPGCFNVVVPVLDNGGFGWRLSFGDLRQPSTSIEGTASSMWAYISPDGSEHLFYTTLHNGETVNAGVRYTRDGSYLRMKEYAGYNVIEFPNGERHRFKADNPNNGTDWRLTHIYNAFSTVPGGIPTTNYVRFEYVDSGTTGVDDKWKIADSHGREHWVTFKNSPYPAAEQDLVETIEIEAFRNGGASRVPATYSFGYEILDATAPLTKPCTGGAGWMNAALLSSLSLPSGESWSFAYNKPALSDTCDLKEKSAVMLSAALPTAGKVKWTWRGYTYSPTMPGAIGIATRTVEADGTDVEYTTYTTPALGSTTMTRHVRVSGEWRAKSKTIQRHGSANGPEFGLPYDPSAPADTGGRRISSDIQDCDPVQQTCTTVREKYVKYEWDFNNFCNIDYPCQQNRNRRQLSERTVFVNDANREATVTHDQFDGLGHHRYTTTGGTFPSGNYRQSFVNYNPGVGTYNASNGSGFTMLQSSAPWILGTYDSATEDDGTQIARIQACFDASNGFLKSRRTRGGAAPLANDLMTVFTGNAAGFVTKEEYFGGDRNNVPTGTNLCNVTPAHDSANLHTYTIEHSYEHGSLKTSRYLDKDGNAVSFYSVDNDIDLGTGLVRVNRDTAGATFGTVTTFDYDTSGRLTNVKPTSVFATTYSYANANGATRAKVSVDTGTGPTRIASEIEFDPLGRVWREKKLMPGSQWSVRETLYDELGRRKTVSEPGFGSPSPKLTTFEYDIFDRPTKVTAPDGAETTWLHTGVQKTKRSQKVATTETTETEVAVEEQYDRAGRLISVKENADGAAVTTTYAYDVGNRLKQVTMGSSPQQNRYFNYDLRGLLTSEQHPESGTTSYESDARGKVVERTTALPETLDYEYDRAERLRFVRKNNLDLKRFTYDSGPGAGNGKIASAIRHHRDTPLAADVTVTESYTYFGDGGRLSEKTTASSTGESFTDKYEYDAFGQIERIDYPTCSTCSPAAPGRSVTSHYANGLLSDIFGYTSATSLMTYHANGMLSQLRHLNANGDAGPLYQQTLDNGMPRPGSITVINFCDDFAITGQPQDKNVISGNPANVQVTAPGATTYAWYQGNSTTPLSGQSGSTLTVPVTQTTTFWVRVANGYCTIDSRKVTVTVTSCPAPDATITVQTGVLASGVLSASVPPSSGATYNWTISGGTITAGTGTSTITFRAGCSGAASLGVTVTASCGTSASDSRTVAITPLSITVSDPPSIAQGGTATLSASIVGTPNWTISWQPDGLNQNASASPVTRNASPAGTTTYTATVTDASGCSASDNALVTVIPPAPFALSATAVTTTQVALSWQFTGSKDHFEIHRNGSLLTTTPNTTYADPAVTPTNAYVYEVRAVKSGTSSSNNPRDLATTIMLATIASGIVVDDSHLTQLQTAVNRVRSLVSGLGDYPFTPGVAPGLPIKAIHILDLRSALTPARNALGLTAVNYTTNVATGALIRKEDVTDIQGGVR